MRYDRSEVSDTFGYMDDSPAKVSERNRKLRSRINAVIIAAGLALTMTNLALNGTMPLLILGTMCAGVGAVTIYFHRSYPDECVRAAGLVLFGVVLGILHIVCNNEGNFDITIPCCYGAAAGLVLIGALMASFPHFRKAMKEKRCTLEVTARCAGIDSNKRGRGSGYEYMHIWEFSVGRETVKVPDKIWTRSARPCIGDFEEIIVNPDDPEDIYREERSYKIRLTVYGVLIALAGAAVIGTMLYIGSM